MAGDFQQDRRRYCNTRQTEEYSGLRGLAKRRCTGVNSPPYLRIGGRVVYDLDAVDEWMRQHTFSNTSQFSAAQAMTEAAAAGA